MSTPSKRRKEGYNAFGPNTDPEDICPYRKDWQSYDKENWLEGWDKAFKEQKEQAIEEQEEKNRTTIEKICTKFYAVTSIPVFETGMSELIDLIKEYMEEGL